jgi:hypothetical protein
MYIINITEYSFANVELCMLTIIEIIRITIQLKMLITHYSTAVIKYVKFTRVSLHG